MSQMMKLLTSLNSRIKSSFVSPPKTLFLLLLLIIAITPSTSSATNSSATPPCDYDFRPYVQNARQGWLNLNVRNPTLPTSTKKSIRYGHFLACPTLTLRKQLGGEEVTVPAGKTQPISSLLEISLKDYQKHPEQTTHHCTFSKWPKMDDNKGKSKETTTKKHIEKCSIQIISEPNGLFSEHCTDTASTNKAQLIDIRQTQGTGANKIIITNSESSDKGAWYSANITCSPDINLVHHGNMYMRLKRTDLWEIPIFPNCSKVLDIDYIGVCRISVYHLCQENTLVAEHSFPYYEGEVSECTYMRAPAQRSLLYRLYFQGLNKIVALVAAALLLANLLSVLIRMVYWLTKFGDFYRGWSVFTREMSHTLAFCSCCFCGLCRRHDADGNSEHKYKLIEQ